MIDSNDHLPVSFLSLKKTPRTLKSASLFIKMATLLYIKILRKP